MTPPKRRVSIIGAGLSGSLLAIILAEKGFEVDIYEKRPDPRKEGFKGGRSINLALSARGTYALEQVDLKEKALKLCVSMPGRIIHDEAGETKFQPYGIDESEKINSISREDLNILLINNAEKYDNVSVYFNHECTKYVPDNDILHFDIQQKGSITVDPEIVIGADGANSTIRRSLISAGRYNYSQEFLEYGYKELEIPPMPNGDYRIEENGLHIWPRSKFMMIALPNLDNTFTVTLFAPFEGEYGFDQLKTGTDVLNYFNKHFKDVIPHIPNLTEQFFEHPTSNLVTIKTDPWYYGDDVLLIGDAAHAIIPFYGQGMNASFEDCRLLMEYIEKEDKWSQILRKFSTNRKPNADAIAKLSYDNFVEMRDSVTDDEFLKRKEAELELYEKYPNKIISKYSMVTFHPEIPYSRAKEKGEILEKTIKEVFTSLNDPSEFDPKSTKEKILQQYKEIEGSNEDK